MDVIALITVFLVLTLLWVFLLHFEKRKHDKRESVRMALIAAENPQKHIYEVI